ncbi:MAG: glycosyltransferase family 2 protein, partial [Candidatus Omnitrophota bacterium]
MISDPYVQQMISVVILTFNSQDYICDCLSSVMAQGITGLEIIVVDNGSVDKTLALIRWGYPGVILIENNINRGASQARNQGIECARGAWILTLDSDVILGQNFLQEFLLAEKGFADNIGMVQTSILNKDGRYIYSQGVYLSPWRRFHDINRGKPGDTAHPGVQKILGPCSAAAFYRHFMLDQIKEETGYFDERFFFLVEDVDLAWRARRAGWHVFLLLRLECRHMGNGSATNPALRQYFSFR